MVHDGLRVEHDIVRRLHLGTGIAHCNTVEIDFHAATIAGAERHAGRIAHIVGIAGTKIAVDEDGAVAALDRDVGLRPRPQHNPGILVLGTIGLPAGITAGPVAWPPTAGEGIAACCDDGAGVESAGDGVAPPGAVPVASMAGLGAACGGGTGLAAVWTLGRRGHRYQAANGVAWLVSRSADNRCQAPRQQQRYDRQADQPPAWGRRAVLPHARWSVAAARWSRRGPKFPA